MCYKYVGNKVIDITDANHDTFKKENAGKPKMLLFTDKKSVPITYRALSTYFDVSCLLLLTESRKLLSSESSMLLKKHWWRNTKWISSLLSSCRKLVIPSSRNTQAQVTPTSNSSSTSIFTQKHLSSGTKLMHQFRMQHQNHGFPSQFLGWVKTRLTISVSRKMALFA